MRGSPAKEIRPGRRAPTRLASRERRRDAHFIALRHRSLHAVEKANVLAVDVDEDEAPHLARFVVDALFDARESLVEVLDDIADRGARSAYLGEFVGQLAKWCWNQDVWHW